MNPIYKPSGKAAEYAEYALNIYNGCNHGCIYCFSPLMLKKDRKTFHAIVEPRKGIVEATKRQLDKEQIVGRLIHLYFTCDAYPNDIDTTPTREIIKAVKESGNNVQILTKGGSRAERDFDLLDSNDWFGVTITGEMQNNVSEPKADSWVNNLRMLKVAKNQGINTWVSAEPVMNAQNIQNLCQSNHKFDLIRIGKLNYAGLNPRLKEIHDSIKWGEFGRECERLCKEYNRNYYIKESLRALM